MVKEFIVKTEYQKTLELPISDLVKRELTQDLGAFTVDQQETISNMLANKVPATDSYKISGVKEAIAAWWYNKYGFPYSDKPAVTEVLRRKYSPPEEVRETVLLQQKLFAAIKINKKPDIAALKEEYEKKYPDQLEGIEVIFQFKNFLKDQNTIDATRGYERSRKDTFESITQFQFLITHFVSNNSENKEFLANFWEILEEMARATNDSENITRVNKLRKGVLSQVAIYKICDRLGIKPKLSHPKEDAFDAIDLWTDSETPVQIKGARDDQEKPTIIETEAIPFPNVQIDSEGQTTFLSPYLRDQTQKFRMKLSEYEMRVGKHLKGYLMVIPYSKFDFVTGEPSDDIVQFFKETLEKIGGNNKSAAEPTPRREGQLLDLIQPADLEKLRAIANQKRFNYRDEQQMMDIFSAVYNRKPGDKTGYLTWRDTVLAKLKEGK